MNSQQFSLYLPAFFMVLMSCGTPGQNQPSADGPDSPTGYAIENVNVIPMDGRGLLTGQTVLISDSKITEVGAADQVALSEGITRIDGTNKYLVPGLSEMHAHIPVAENGDDEYVKEILFLYLSNGVTTIRGMLGNPYHLTLKEQVAAGDVLSPRIFTSGPSFNGNSCSSVEIARQMVTEQSAAGYDFLKLHPGIKLDVFNALTETANELGIGFAGHVPVDVGIRRALESKYLSVDHVDGYLEGLVPAEAGVQPDQNGFFGLNFTGLADPGLIAGLVQMTVDNGVWVVPTQSLFERWGGLDDAQTLASQPEMKYIPPATLANWISRKEDFMSQDVFTEETITRFLEIRRQLIHDLYHGGAMLALGSDAPQVFNVPGFSLHHELNSYILSGLTPQQALEIGTINPAKFFGMDDEFGTVKAGYWADLILVDQNPLDDISNLRNPAGVMVRGTWLSRDDINARLSEIAAKYN